MHIVLGDFGQRVRFSRGEQVTRFDEFENEAKKQHSTKFVLSTHTYTACVFVYKDTIWYSVVVTARLKAHGSEHSAANEIGMYCSHCIRTEHILVAF